LLAAATNHACVQCTWRQCRFVAANAYELQYPDWSCSWTRHIPC